MAHLTGDGGEVALVRFGESQEKTVQISQCFFCLFVNLTANSHIFIGSSEFILPSAQIVVRPALESTVVCRGFIWTHMIFIMRGE